MISDFLEASKPARPKSGSTKSIQAYRVVVGLDIAQLPPMEQAVGILSTKLSL